MKSLADNKQLLGMRYAEWCTAAPSLEADIAAAAMGLDDLGHSRVLYGCLKELPDGESVDEGTYTNVRYLDQPWTDWSQFVAANAVLDTAFTDVHRETDGRWRVRLERGERFAELWGDEHCRWIQVYTGAERRDVAMAVEPMTCGPDAFNPGPTHEDLLTLAAGDDFSCSWGISGG